MLIVTTYSTLLAIVAINATVALHNVTCRTPCPLALLERNRLICLCGDATQPINEPDDQMRSCRLQKEPDLFFEIGTTAATEGNRGNDSREV